MKAKKERRTILTIIFVIVSLGLFVGSASAEDIICNGEVCEYPGGNYGYIIVKNDGKLTIDGNVSCKQVEVVKGTLHLYGGWEAEKFIVRNGTVYVKAYNSGITGTGTFFLQCDELLLEGGCVLTANGAGGDKRGVGGRSGDGHGGGGGYGGRGGNGYKANGGGTYGDYRSLTIEMGSASGSGYYGGGKIFIIAEKAAIHGTITANGEGRGNDYGGGSGGGILIQCEDIDFTGSISANGGNGSGDSKPGGGGGGGRIKIIYDTGFAVELLSQIQTNGGTAKYNGANGTIWTNVRPAPPALVAPDDGARVGNPPTFRFTVLDLSHELDGREYDRLSCKIELSRDNFETISKTFDQNISMEGWSELEYLSGNEAQFTPPEPLLPGRYQWRAYVYDVRLWSKPSEIYTFAVPPDGDGGILVESSADFLYADGKSPAIITATIMDSEGKGIAGKGVEMSVDDGGEISKVKDNGDGTYTATYTAGKTPGMVTITATTPDDFGTVEIKLGCPREPCEPCEICEPCEFCKPCDPCECEPSDVTTNTLVVTGTVYRPTGEIAENGLPVEVSITTQELTEKDTTGKIAGDGKYSATFVDMQNVVAKAGDEILVTVTDAQGKLIGQVRHTLTAAEVEATNTQIDVTPTIEPATVTLKLHKGINVISVPTEADKDLRMSDLAQNIGKENVAMIIRYDYEQGKFISYLPTFPYTSPANAVVQPNEGYIVVMKADKDVAFEGTTVSDKNPSDDKTAAPSLMPLILSSDFQSTSIPSLHSRACTECNEVACFVVTGNTKQAETRETLNEVTVNVRNLRTSQTVENVTGTLAGLGNYVATFVASSGEFMMRTGDKLEITAQDANHRFTIEPVIYTLTPDDISDYALFMPLRFSLPKQFDLLQNYPNPFNPETWLPYQLARDANVNISIYNTKGQLVRTLLMGNQRTGVYVQKGKAAYWDGRDNEGERVASGVYFYTLQAGDFTATRKMAIMK